MTEVRSGLTRRIGRGQGGISHSNGVEQVHQKLESFGNWKVFQSSRSERWSRQLQVIVVVDEVDRRPKS